MPKINLLAFRKPKLPGVSNYLLLFYLFFDGCPPFVVLFAGRFYGPIFALVGKTHNVKAYV